MVLDLQVVEAMVCAHLAALDLLQHPLDHVVDLFHVTVHLAQELHGLRQVLLRIVLAVARLTREREGEDAYEKSRN